MRGVPVKGARPSKVAAGSHPLNDAPRPPAGLSKDARAEWIRVAPVLIERQILTIADLPMLEAYVVQFGIVRECRRLIAAHGPIYINASGDMKRNPACGELNAATMQMRLLGNEFGLTPYSRSRTAIAGNDDDHGADDLGL